jgi:hypothetical protein
LTIPVKDCRLDLAILGPKPDAILANLTFEALGLDALNMCSSMSGGKRLRYWLRQFLRRDASISEIGIRLGDNVAAAREEAEADE